MGRPMHVRAVLAAAVGAALLTGCGLVGGGSDGTPTTEHESLATALGYVPDDLTQVEFGDPEEWQKDHGFADASPAELTKDEKFWRESQNASYAESGLWQYARAMDGWGWSATDISWSATAHTTSSKKFIHYVRFRDSTDVGTVRKSLLAHDYRAKGDLLVGPVLGHAGSDVADGVETAIGRTVHLYPDKHLMVSGWGSGTATDLPDEDASLGARAEVRRAVAPIRTASEVSLSTGADACRTPTRMTPVMKRQLTGLGQVTTSATAVVSDSKSIATVEYSSEAAARKDLPRRKAFLGKDSLRTNQPYRSLAHFAVEQEGTALHYTITGRAQIVPQMLATGDSPWDLCVPSAKSAESAES